MEKRRESYDILETTRSSEDERNRNIKHAKQERRSKDETKKAFAALRACGGASRHRKT